jgi:CBS domain-containing protein/uncharacterized protein (DUF2267 family)
MSLERFFASHLVVQSPSTRIYDAVRAMGDHRIGAVLVHDGKELVGIVTDRDIALKAVEDDLDPFDFRLCDIMSSPVASVQADSTVVDVAELMLERRVRRVPILDGQKIVGLVTLDDLLLEHALDAFTLAALMRAQLRDPARLEPRGMGTGAVQAKARVSSERAQLRHDARTRQSYARLVNRILALTGFAFVEQAEIALEVVVSGLLRNIHPVQAGNLLAQLPLRVREYAVARFASGPDVTLSREAIENELARRLRSSPAVATELLPRVARAVVAGICQGELTKLTDQLPADLKALVQVPAESNLAAAAP